MTDKTKDKNPPSVSPEQIAAYRSLYLEPGEAWALNAGYLVTTVLDTLHNGSTSLAILDMSAACHTPDVIEMPYRPPLLGAGGPRGVGRRRPEEGLQTLFGDGVPS